MPFPLYLHNTAFTPQKWCREGAAGLQAAVLVAEEGRSGPGVQAGTERLRVPSSWGWKHGSRCGEIAAGAFRLVRGLLFVENFGGQKHRL